MIKAKLEEYLKVCLKTLGFDEADVFVTASQDVTHGDYATNVALKLAKEKGEQPMAVAEKIADLMKKDLPEYLEVVAVAAPGFINFTVSSQFLADEVNQMLAQKKVVLEPRVEQGKTVIVEYSSPNIAKPMGVGHLRSTIIGQSLANIYQTLGYNVVSINYVGDWGTQFGKLIAAYKHWHNDVAFEKDPIPHLLELYVRFTNESKENPEMEQEGRDEFSKLEQGDKENLALWEKFREVSFQEFETLYHRLGVEFSDVYGESQFRDKTDGVYRLLEEKHLVQSEGQALVLDFTDQGLGTTLVRKSDGSSVYLTRDIANLEYRVKKWQPDEIIYVVGQDQSLHFKQLFALAEKLGIKTNLVHVGFGLVLLEGKRMRTREGKTVFLSELLDEAVSKAKGVVAKKSVAVSKEEQESIAELVGIGSVKYNDLSQNRLTTIDFNWEKMLASEGNSAPYLFYTLARTRSVLSQATGDKTSIEASVLSEHEIDLLKHLCRYGEIVQDAAGVKSPNIIANYLFVVAQKFNAFYATSPILKSENQVRQSRLGLTAMTGLILEHGLNLLGIAAPARM